MGGSAETGPGTEGTPRLRGSGDSEKGEKQAKWSLDGAGATVKSSSRLVGLWAGPRRPRSGLFAPTPPAGSVDV